MTNVPFCLLIFEALVATEFQVSQKESLSFYPSPSPSESLLAGYAVVVSLTP